MCGGIRDHDRGEALSVLLAVGAEVLEVDVALVVGLDDDYLHTGSNSGGGVGTMGGGRDKTNVSMPLAYAMLVVSNSQQSTVLSGCAGVRIEVHIIHPRTLLQVFPQL